MCGTVLGSVLFRLLMVHGVSVINEGFLSRRYLEICLHHHLNQLLKIDLGLPA